MGISEGFNCVDSLADLNFITQKLNILPIELVTNLALGAYGIDKLIINPN